LKGALGKAFLWDYLGGLVIAVSLPIAFLPALGLLKTTFLMGLLNACAALILLLAVCRRQAIRAAVWLGLVAVFASNVAGMAGAQRLERFLEEEQYEDERVEVLRWSPYQKIVLTRSPRGAVALYLNNQGQFRSGLSEVIYHEALVHPAMTLAGFRRSVLILGGGDGLALREVLKYPEVQRVTLVDIDRAVVDLATTLPVLRALNEGSFSDPRVEVVTDDAFGFVKRERGADRYDVIIVDLPDPTDDSLARLYSKPFYGMLRRLIGPRGVVAVQSSYFMSFVQRTIFVTMIAAGFRSVAAYHPAGQGAYDAVTLGSHRGDVRDALDHLQVPVESMLIRDRRSLARVFAVPGPPFRWRDVRVNRLFTPTILNDPAHHPFWNYQLKPQLRRLWERWGGARMQG
jgi:spermidine synthase